MAQWKKVIVSGSDAALNSLVLSTDLPVIHGGTGQSLFNGGHVLVGNGASALSSAARGSITGDTKIVITGGTSASIGNVVLTAAGNIASGSRLNKISTLSDADSTFIVGSATGWVAETGATARTSMGLGTADNVEFANVIANQFTNDSTVAASHFTGSFTGSFRGDGSGLTGLSPSAVSSYTNPGSDRLVTSVDASTINGEANLLFDGSNLRVTGSLKVTGGVTGSNLRLTGLGTGVDDTVVIQLSTGQLATDEIDSRVWGTTLVDGAGVLGQATYWKDANTISGSTAYKFDGSNLRVTGSIKVSGQITGSNLRLNSVAAGLDDSVLVITSTGQIVSDEIDPRVWGSTLIDGAGVGGQVTYWSDANTVSGSSRLKFDNSGNLRVTGSLKVSGGVTGSNLRLDALGTGVDNTVVVQLSTGQLATDEIDARVWGATLVSSTTGFNTGDVVFADGVRSTTSENTFQYNSTSDTLFVPNISLSGNLTVFGTASFQHASSLVVSDRFILLNSGSTSGDGGIIIRSGSSNGTGATFGWDQSVRRFGYQLRTGLNASGSVMLTDAYAAAVVDIDGGMSDLAVHQQRGNIKISGGDIYIYT